MKNFLTILITLTALTLQTYAQQKYPDVHDPVMAQENGRYYIFSTGFGIDMMSSDDMENWQREKSPLTPIPEWPKEHVRAYRGHTWAPDIIKVGDKWYLYYSCSTFGKNISAIGVATNKTLDPDSPEYAWTDLGKVIQSTPMADDWNAIDPNVIIDKKGNPWMTFGSFWDGIQLVRLKKDMLTPIGQPKTIARRYRPFNISHLQPNANRNAIEAPFLIYKDGYYYLFASHDYCCKGLDSNYKTVVGRSRDIAGPYLDRKGRDMAQGGGSMLIGETDEYSGVGHCSVYKIDGKWYFLAHGYDKRHNGASKLFLRQMQWSDGWPVIPGSKAEAYYAVEITNPLPEKRRDEIIEIPIADLDAEVKSYVVENGHGKTTPSQITHDGMLIFAADVDSMGSAQYTIHPGHHKIDFPNNVFGRQFPERLDDFAWENDRCAYRAYGPGLQRSGERAYGYDIWCKSVPYPILEQRYYDHCKRHISFHEDHGNGLDDYSVGATLGAGTAALVSDDGQIVYPYCYRDFEILDNGPLRFTFKLTYNPVKVDGDYIAESRIISLDKGSWFNKTTLNYQGLKGKKSLVQGIVVHSSNPTDYKFLPENGLVLYRDLTGHPDNGNGEIYLGLYSPLSPDLKFMDVPANGPSGVSGHACAIGEYTPGNTFTYWWGAGWSKGGVSDYDDWSRITSGFSRRMANPLVVRVENM